MIILDLLHSAFVRACDTKLVRGTVRAAALTLLFCILCGAIVSAAEHGAAPAHAPAASASTSASPAAPKAAPVPAPQFYTAAEAAEKIKQLSETGFTLWKKGDREGAERAFSAALQLNSPDGPKRALMLDLAQLYENEKDPLKAVSVLEKFLLVFPKDAETPTLLLRLGVLYRNAGAHGAATARFFQVLNSTLQFGPEDVGRYRRIAMKARLEIAETFADQGDIEEARKYFSRLQLLDLEPADLERVRFRGPQLQHEAKQWSEAEVGLNKFIEDFPESGYVPEAHYRRAKCLEALGRKQEAVLEVIALLRSEEPREPERARQTDYWKRRTGNELANQFYEQGDFHGALSIYQALARVNGDPSWSWPAVYQVGLCFERLKMPDRAAEAYRAIINPDPAPPAGTKLTETLVSLQNMAKWRLEHLDWIEDFGKRLQGLSAGKTAES